MEITGKDIIVFKVTSHLWLSKDPSPILFCWGDYKGIKNDHFLEFLLCLWGQGIWCCCDMGCCCGSDCIPCLGTSICRGCSWKRKKKKKRPFLFLPLIMPTPPHWSFWGAAACPHPSKPVCHGHCQMAVNQESPSRFFFICLATSSACGSSLARDQSNLHHSSNLSCCSDNAGSSTCSAIRELHEVDLDPS